jgi:hypothetical protein
VDQSYSTGGTGGGPSSSSSLSSPPPPPSSSFSSNYQHHSRNSINNGSRSHQNGILNTSGMSGTTTNSSSKGSVRMLSNSKKYSSFKRRFHTTNQVEVSRGVVLVGEELEDYCKKRGLCPLCAKTKVKRRVFKLFRKNRWEPVTQLNPDGGGSYIVYKGYCVRSNCFTLEQAKRLADATTTSSSTSPTTMGGVGIVRAGNGSPRIVSPGRKSHFGSGSPDHRKDPSKAGQFSGRHNVHSNNNNNDGDDDYDEEDDDDDDENDDIDDVDRTSFRQSRVWATNGGSNNNNNHEEDDASDVHRGLTHRRQATAYPSMRMKDEHHRSQRQSTTRTTTNNANNNNNNTGGGDNGRDRVLPSQIIQRTVQGLVDDATKGRIHILDLSGIALHLVDMATLMGAIRTNTVIAQLSLENCQLRDDTCAIIGKGLTEAYDMPLVKLYLRSNSIQNDGVDYLCPYLESSTSLQKLDLSRNGIGTMGGVAIFNSFRRNRLATIRSINLAHNELWDLDCDEDGSGSFGIRSFLGKNRTLKSLNLEGNFLHDEGMEALCLGLTQGGDQATLERLFLRGNSIGDDGAIALGECLSINKSLVYIDLAENEIGNTGGRALLSALDQNMTIQDISGLWRNQIDRRFITVAIRRLLLSTDRGQPYGSTRKIQDPVVVKVNDRVEAPPSPLPRRTERIASDAVASKKTVNEETIPGEGDVSDLSDDPMELYDDSDSDDDDDDAGVVGGNEQSQRQRHQQRDMDRDKLVTPLKLLPSLEANSTIDEEELILVDDDGGGGKASSGSSPLVETLMETNQEVSYNFDRVTYFHSSPLVYFEKELGIHRGIPLQDSKYERCVLEEALSIVADRGAEIELTVETATLDRFSSFFAEKDSHVMHFSCHGLNDSLALENGYGSLQTLPLDGLTRLIAAVGSSLNIVFVSSCNSKMIGEAFVDAGIPHVVCCQKDEQFRDPVAFEFMKCFYQQAAQQRLLSEAFETAVEVVASLPIARNLRRVRERFRLLPEMPDVKGYHNTPVFFNEMVPGRKVSEHFEGSPHLPPLPTNFTGREIDLYEILESLRVDDIVKVSGTPGYGKESIVSAVAEYAMQRRKMFSIDDIFWLPAPEGVTPSSNSMYADLCLCCNLLRTSKDDIWDTNDAVIDCKERLRLELEEFHMVLVVDDRSFSSRGSQDGLEKFISFILNAATAKVILITTRGHESGSLLSQSTSGSRIEESNIEIDTLDFRSTALLFGSMSKFISSNGCPVAHSATEFAQLLEPPFVARMPDPSLVTSQRRADLFARMGSGLPSAVINAAQAIDKSSFIEIIKIANKPEIHVESLSELEHEVRRRIAQKDKAVAERNYMRAMDLDSILEELEEMRPEFPTLKDLKEEEQLMKSDLADAVANRRYDTANDLKRELLTLKKKIMRERRLLPEESFSPREKLNEFQAQMESMMEEADDSFKLDDLDLKVTFDILCDGINDRACTFSIYYGDIHDFNHPVEARGIVCWTNEACHLESTIEGRQLLDKGGADLQKDIDSLAVVAESPYGTVRCTMGNAVILGPSHSYSKTLAVPVVILTAGPFHPSGSQGAAESSILETDEDYFDYRKIMLRSCYRSSMVLARHSELQALGVTLNSPHKKGPSYEETIRIGLQILVEEVKFSALKDIHLIAKTPKEASIMVRIMEQNLGYQHNIVSASKKG